MYLRTAPEEDTDFIRGIEGAAVEQAAAVTVLSRSDAEYIREKLLQPSPIRASKEIQVGTRRAIAVVGGRLGLQPGPGLL